MRKLLKEFKAFINKGSVMDLAVGMIIGSAFTAIVNSLVNSILKPLINWIPISASGLQTVLREAVLDASGNVVTEALILDWGAVISAIITFFCTAIVLFLIIKAFNKAKDIGNKAKEGLEDKLEDLKNKGKEEEAQEVVATEEVVEEVAEPVVEEAPVVEEVVENKETTEELLKQIIELLKDKQ